ncbi:hypothetical protein, partial [Acinetobacter baumannii]|uniref:hypothetical protein n=1 Tax=Acinetobacter baumannii TaxID=470 RepID=UPI0011120C5D
MSPASTFTPDIPASYGLSLLSLMLERRHAEEDILAGSKLTRQQLQDQHAQIGGWQYVIMLNNA